MSAGTTDVGKLPLFVFPTSLNFYSDDISSQQQVLTVYNPYNFTLHYKVLCTAPKKYRVIDAEGTIKPRCCVDIYIKHKEVCASNERVRDKFRLQVNEVGQKPAIGKKDIIAVLYPTKEQCQGPEETFESMPSLSMTDARSVHGTPVDSTKRNMSAGSVAKQANNQTSWVILVAAFLCVVVLMMPLNGDTNSSLPQYAHVTLHQKLIASYILEPARVIKSGYLRRFKKGFLSKSFKYVFVELYSDSHMLWYRDQCSSKPDGVVFLKDVCDFLAVGPYTQSIPTRPNLPRGSSERHILAIPVHPCRETYVHWFLFDHDGDLNDWMVKINSALPPLPPPVGSPDDTRHLKEPPPPYTDVQQKRADGMSNNHCNSSAVNGVAASSEPLAMSLAAGTSLWGWTWGWGGGWGCDGWGCFDYGPAAGGANVAVHQSCGGGTVETYGHDAQYNGSCLSGGADHAYDNGAGYDYYGYGFDYGCEHAASSGMESGIDAGVDTGAFDACVFDIGF